MVHKGLHYFNVQEGANMLKSKDKKREMEKNLKELKELKELLDKKKK